MTTTKTNTLAGLSILVVDDEDDIRLGLERVLSRFGADLSEAPDGRDALRVMENEPVDLVLTDLMMPHMSGADLLREIKDRWPSTEVVMFTGYGTIRTAVQCVRDGASHFLTKPFDNDEVSRIVERLGRQIITARERCGAATRTLIAEDPRMRGVVDLIQRVAGSPVPVLVEGESGTGKEVVARAIHRGSAVAERPFQAVNAAALPDTLLESELFGHRKGAFTGADADRDGLFVAAAGGTVFLDEVASMSASFQGKLLRVLQEKLVRPLGAARDIPAEFRLVAATNQDLEKMCEEGAFRRDLFYRLGVVRIHVPPLRYRPQDVRPLAHHFLEDAVVKCRGDNAPIPELSVEAEHALRTYPWPGNVRELENAIQRAVIVGGTHRIEANDLGLDVGRWEAPAMTAGDDLDYNEGKQAAIERFQREYLDRALAQTQGNISHAAEACGMTRATLQRILRQLGVDRSTFVER